MSFSLGSQLKTFLLPLIAVSFGIVSCQPQAEPEATTPGSAPVAANGGTVTLLGAGASFPAPLYQRWAAAYNKQNPNVRISYQSVGSGAGVQQFIQGTVDFAASDVAIAKEEAAKVERGAIALPLTAGAIVLAYNLPNVQQQIQLPRAVYCDIFLGQIDNWNTPAIVKANPDANLPNQPIRVVHRADGSGTTAVFTQHLSAICPEWKQKVGTSKTVAWPTGIGAKGNEGVTAQIQQTPGAIGYVEYGYATQNKLSIAALENQAGNYVAPTPESAARTLESAELPEDLITFISDPAGEQSYPIVTYTWLLAYDEYPNDQDKARALESFVNWTLTEGQKYSTELGYIPLPERVVAKVKPVAEQIAAAEKPGG